MGAIVGRGATPVFVDIDPQTFNMDLGKVAGALSGASKGRRPSFPSTCSAAAPTWIRFCRGRKARVAVIEDAAQAIGSEYNGRRAGTHRATSACFSFFPSKNLGAYGDGGMLTTNDPALADRLRMLRVHGTRRNTIHDIVGINSRLDALQAAVLRVKLRHLERGRKGGSRTPTRYRELLAQVSPRCVLPDEPLNEHAAHLQPVRHPLRAARRAAGASEGAR